MNVNDEMVLSVPVGSYNDDAPSLAEIDMATKSVLMMTMEYENGSDVVAEAQRIASKQTKDSSDMMMKRTTDAYYSSSKQPSSSITVVTVAPSFAEIDRASVIDDMPAFGNDEEESFNASPQPDSIINSTDKNVDSANHGDMSHINPRLSATRGGAATTTSTSPTTPSTSTMIDYLDPDSVPPTANDEHTRFAECTPVAQNPFLEGNNDGIMASTTTTHVESSTTTTTLHHNNSDLTPTDPRAVPDHHVSDSREAPAQYSVLPMVAENPFLADETTTATEQVVPQVKTRSSLYVDVLATKKNVPVVQNPFLPTSATVPAVATAPYLECRKNAAPVPHNPFLPGMTATSAPPPAALSPNATTAVYSRFNNVSPSIPLVHHASGAHLSSPQLNTLQSIPGTPSNNAPAYTPAVNNTTFPTRPYGTVTTPQPFHAPVSLDPTPAITAPAVVAADNPFLSRPETATSMPLNAQTFPMSNHLLDPRNNSAPVAENPFLAGSAANIPTTSNPAMTFHSVEHAVQTPSSPALYETTTAAAEDPRIDVSAMAADPPSTAEMNEDIFDTTLEESQEAKALIQSPHEGTHTADPGMEASAIAMATDAPSLAEISMIAGTAANDVTEQEQVDAPSRASYEYTPDVDPQLDITANVDPRMEASAIEMAADAPSLAEISMIAGTDMGANDVTEQEVDAPSPSRTSYKATSDVDPQLDITADIDPGMEASAIEMAADAPSLAEISMIAGTKMAANELTEQQGVDAPSLSRTSYGHKTTPDVITTTAEAAEAPSLAEIDMAAEAERSSDDLAEQAAEEVPNSVQTSHAPTSTTVKDAVPRFDASATAADAPSLAEIDMVTKSVIARELDERSSTGSTAVAQDDSFAGNSSAEVPEASMAIGRSRSKDEQNRSDRILERMESLCCIGRCFWP